MKTLTLLAILLALSLLEPHRAHCNDCLLAGIPCYSSFECGAACSCFLPDGIGQPGFCN